MNIVRSPEGADAAYLASLNACFGAWGGEELYDWVFRRVVGGRTGDRFVVTDESGEWIAGSGVSWRTLTLARGAKLDVGIMTGSWTLPAARGKGCFTRIIDESLSWARERHAGLLLAFVTVTNASYRRLEVAGSALFPTRYVFSTPETPRVASAPAVRTLPVTDALLAELEEQARALSAGRTAIAYGPGEWRGQLVDRPAQIEIVEVEGAGRAVLEVHGDTLRAQALLPRKREHGRPLLAALLAHAQAGARKLFTFSTDPEAVATDSDGLGLGGVDGFVTALVADADALSSALGERVEEGDASPLAPGGRATIAPLFIQSGDRM